jgi:hypothetical protein
VQDLVGGERVDLAREQVRIDGIDDRLEVHLTRRPERGTRGVLVAHGIPLAEHRRPLAQVKGEIAATLERREPPLGHDRADANLDARASLVEELPRQERGAQERVDEPRELEEGPVLPVEMNGQHRNLREADEILECFVPRSLHHLSALRIEVGDLAGREDAEHAARLQIADGRAQGSDVRRRRAAAPERIDEQERVAQRRDSSEEVVGQDLHVAAGSAEHRREHHPLDGPERVVGDHDAAARARDALEIELVRGPADA